VDGGAFDGDTLRSVFSSQYPVEAAAVFEPDPDNLNELIKYLSSVSSYQIYLWPCAIYSSTQQLYFSSNIGEGSHLLSSGNISIQATALDDVLRPFKPNLIKLDIEGAEVDGLMGAKRIIRENRPGLAICTYHRPEHMWQIPSLINSWDLGYKFYMRMHKHNGFELVMYAKAV
jgi:FkbM family methyltransferase